MSHLDHRRGRRPIDVIGQDGAVVHDRGEAQVDGRAAQVGRFGVIEVHGDRNGGLGGEFDERPSDRRESASVVRHSVLRELEDQGQLRLLCRVDERLGVVQQNDVEGCQTLPSLRCVAGEFCGICEHCSLLSLV